MDYQNTNTHCILKMKSLIPNYNFLANRFYEALNYNVYPLFTEECSSTIQLSGYDIDLNSREYNLDKLLEWKEIAKEEKQKTITSIKQLILS